MRKNILFATFMAVFTVFGWTGQGFADNPIYTGSFSDNAIKGYDTVSYFMGDGVPVKGSKDFQTIWLGASWLFSSQANLDKFKADPEKYAPQYGGYCSWAAAHDVLAKGDPNTYLLENGKIYLNYDKSISDAWLPRKDELIPLADVKYPELVDLK
jgi:YHS domain-containing protein